MSQTITISKTEFEKLVERIKTLESIVFGKKQVVKAVRRYKADKLAGKLHKMRTPDEILTPRQEAILTKKYEKAKKDFARGEGVIVTSAEEMMQALRS